eukprot:TRINITY_DN5695_c0_g2_i2.p4 TRINITY_DN5695_c0_g2~~TRINITY_DN5695_c0_g2_i2.p4  ORF type:complete len:211 (-),score=-7.88 TRINITY_DN5695_c0_g2_i2:1462-2094(-)
MLRSNLVGSFNRLTFQNLYFVFCQLKIHFFILNYFAEDYIIYMYCFMTVHIQVLKQVGGRNDHEKLVTIEIICFIFLVHCLLQTRQQYNLKANGSTSISKLLHHKKSWYGIIGLIIILIIIIKKIDINDYFQICKINSMTEFSFETIFLLMTYFCADKIKYFLFQSLKQQQFVFTQYFQLMPNQIQIYAESQTSTILFVYEIIINFWLNI